MQRGPCCDEDWGGSHYHCGYCGAVTGMYGHFVGELYPKTHKFTIYEGLPDHRYDDHRCAIGARVVNLIAGYPIVQPGYADPRGPVPHPSYPWLLASTNKPTVQDRMHNVHVQIGDWLEDFHDISPNDSYDLVSDIIDAVLEARGVSYHG